MLKYIFLNLTFAINKFSLHRIVGLSSCFNHQTKSIPIRTLYSLSSLGIDGYQANRERISTFMSHNADSFKSKMIEFSQPGSTNMIFTEDLKNMIHMANKTDIDLVVKMLKKYLFYLFFYS